MDWLRVLDVAIFDWGNIVWAVGLLWWSQTQPGHPLKRTGRWGAALLLLMWVDQRVSPGESPAWYVVRALLLTLRLTCVFGLVKSLPAWSGPSRGDTSAPGAVADDALTHR